MPVQIVEVLYRSLEGVTEPYFCRGDDDRLFYVKGRGAGRKSQVCEWLCGHLALALGLPIAPFEIVDVPSELFTLDAGIDLNDLGAGPAFGSEQIALTQHLTVSERGRIPQQLQRDVLVFDWWIQNEDRTLTEEGGNPNLLWSNQTNSVHIIDHNNAFDTTFSVPGFVTGHVFSGQIPSLFSDQKEVAHYIQRLQKAIPAWDSARNSLPDEWLFLDNEHTVPIDLDFDKVRQQLERCAEPAFWMAEQ